MKGRSVEPALHEVLSYYKQFSLVAFLDIEGAFNNITTEALL